MAILVPCVSLFAALSFLFPLSFADNVSSACVALHSAFPNRLYLPDTTGYNASEASYFAVQARLYPACIVSPTSADAVSSIVKTLTRYGAPFAVRGGGHSANKGFADIANGVTIDLRSINSVNLSDDEKIVSVGAGSLWEDVYEVLDPKNVSVLGGRIGTVGVGGLLTGGGISFFSRQHGWACDFITNFQVVLASGDIVNANPASHPDLFVALKGGQNNFGIVTRFDLQTIAQGKFWGGTIATSAVSDDANLAAFTKFKMSNTDYNSDVSQSFIYRGAANLFITANSLLYAKPIVNASALSDFIAIQPQLANTMRIANVTSITKELEAQDTLNAYSAWATTTFAISPTILSKVHAAWKTWAVALNAQTNNSLTAQLAFQDIPQPPKPANPNALGFPSDSTPQKNLVLCLLQNFWSNAAVSAAIQQGTQDLHAIVENLANDEGVASKFVYLNYAGGFQDPLDGYGPASVQFLKSAARKYDPRGVFQQQVVGGFKLFK